MIIPMGQWQRSPVKQHLTLAVNVSARQFHQADFVTLVHETIARTGIDPDIYRYQPTHTIIFSELHGSKIHLKRGTI